jgi:hypothetical protein
LNFLFDANMPPQLWTAGVAAFSHARFQAGQIGEVVHLRTKFRPDAPDIEWITALGQEGGWTIISRDGFRKKNGAEREVLRRYGLSVFVLQSSWASRPYWELSAQFIAWWPRIVAHSCTTERAALEVPWRTGGKFQQI